MAVTLNNNTLPIIFYNLSYKDFPSFIRVCELWNKCSDLEDFWKKECHRFLEHPQPHEKSWKERFKIIRNILNRTGEISTFTECPKNHISYGLNLSSDGSCYDLLRYTHPDQFKEILLKKCMSDDVTKITIGNVWIVNACGFEKEWILMTNQTKLIICHDRTNNTTEEPITHIDKKICQGEIIYDGGLDIIIKVKKKLLLKNKTDFSEIVVSEECPENSYLSGATKNFILLKKVDKMGVSAIVLDKSSNSSEHILAVNIKGCFASGNFIVTLDQSNTLHIYRDLKPHPLLKQSIKNVCTSNDQARSIQIYQNWILIYTENPNQTEGMKLTFYNIISGEKLIQFIYERPFPDAKDQNFDFRFNGQTIFARTKKEGETHYSTTNFAKRVKKLHFIPFV